MQCLSQKSLEEKMSNVGGRLFGVVMRADSLMDCCLWEVTGSIENVVVVEMVAVGVESMVMADSGVFLEEVMVRVLVLMGGGGTCVSSGMVGERDYCRIPWIM